MPGAMIKYILEGGRIKEILNQNQELLLVEPLLLSSPTRYLTVRKFLNKKISLLLRDPMRIIVYEGTNDNLEEVSKLTQKNVV
jgi:hypothetical protein